MENLFLKLVNMSIAASWIVLAVVVLRFVLKKAPKSVICVLWALVAVKLMCPFTIQSSLSLMPSEEVISGTVISGGGASSGISKDIEKVTVKEDTTVEQKVDTYSDFLENDTSLSEKAENTGKTETNLLQILSVIWLCGIAAILIYGIISYLRLNSKVSASIKLKDNIYICDYIDTPFILGVFKPRIYLPSSLTEKQTEYVIAHEKAHLKRKDNLIKPLGFVLLAVYWFNPIIWAAYLIFSRDIELACDEKVIRNMENDDKRGYSQALLSCSVPRKMLIACPVAFGEVGVKERVKTVLNYKKPAFWVLVVAVAACVAVGVFLMTSPVGLKIDISEADVKSALCFDMGLNSNQLIRELSTNQISELVSRLNSINGAKKDSSLESLTPIYQLGTQLKDGTYIYANIYSEDGESVGVIYKDKYYRITDSNFRQYLLNIFSFGDVTFAENSNKLDYTVDGVSFTYGGVEYDLTQQETTVNSIIATYDVGDNVIIECDVNQYSYYYAVFDTEEENFVNGFFGTNLIWMNDNIYTAVYSLENGVYDYSGHLIESVDLPDGGYIASLTFEDEASLGFILEGQLTGIFVTVGGGEKYNVEMVYYTPSGTDTIQTMGVMGVLPKVWSGRYTLVENDTDMTELYVSDIYEDNGKGLVCYISKIQDALTEEEAKTDSRLEDTEYIYMGTVNKSSTIVICYPNDTQYDENNVEQKTEYETMRSQVGKIRLLGLDDPESTEQSTTMDEESRAFIGNSLMTVMNYVETAKQSMEDAIREYEYFADDASRQTEIEKAQGEYILAYRIMEKPEIINDNLCACKLLVYTPDVVGSSNAVASSMFKTVYVFIAKIDGELYIIRDSDNIPENIIGNTDLSSFSGDTIAFAK